MKYYFLTVMFMLITLTTGIFCQEPDEIIFEDESSISNFEMTISSEEYINNNYVAHSLGFKISKPEQWSFAPQGQIKKGREMVRKKSVKSDIDLSEIWQPLTSISRYPVGKPVDYNPKITISVLDLEMWPGIENSYDAAKSNQLRKKSKKHKGKIKKVSTIKEITVNGKTCAFFEYDRKRKYRGEKKTFHYLAASFVHNEKQFSIICKSLKKDFKNLRKDFLETIQTVKFKD
ncbi:MAG: hypothetical protein ABII20_04065 [Candidatus Omnitrophota bacterium]|nr:hypothetical protein [Candidatus Omnitrophota bacterium]MBU2528084.1 hypothetical protein [bacterium]MBU3929714.1 hypothetical protein [bacterium]MBU4123666.1 hypothetical protein [bacterium]